MSPGDNDDTLLAALPTVYSVALRLRRAGVPPEQIAAGLGIEPLALPTLFDIAEAKLAHLRDHRV
ncbi:MAG: hypothetical protein C0482_10795 [Gordonia sp.]|nr:hypothetical protein [Gordonia sp. (in: high G+C Gram-positive bacteria)]